MRALALQKRPYQLDEATGLIDYQRPRRKRPDRLGS